MNFRNLFTIALFLGAWACCSCPHSLWAQQGSTILRDLTRIPSAVRRFDRQSIQLENGRQLKWDEVLKADAGSEQERFDRLFEKIGKPLFRIRTRLINGDVDGAFQTANALSQMTDIDLLGGRTAFLVYRARMLGELQNGNSAQAIVFFLQCCRNQQKLAPDELKRLENLVISDRDMSLRFSSEFVPILFDADQARQALKTFEELKSSLESPLANSFWIYRASMALTAGDLEDAKRSLLKITNDGESQTDDWRYVVSAQIKITEGQVNLAQSELDSQLLQMSPTARVAAYFLRGQAYKIDPDSIQETDAILSLLTVPAIAERRWPNLSAAALFTAAGISQRANLAKESEILTRQLLTEYPNTYHGRKAMLGGQRVTN